MDKNIIGFFLSGSRGKGFENESSDYDAGMVVKDDVAKKYKKKFDFPFDSIDLPVYGLAEFKNYAKWGSPEALSERYDFSHCKILIDRTGEIEDLIRDKGNIPSDVQYDFVYHALDGYVNAVFRSVKAWKNQNPDGALFESASSVPFFLDSLFGAYSRLRPYNAYLKIELEKYPLEGLPWEPKELVQTLVFILKTGNLKVQQKLLLESEKFFRDKGFGKVFDAWEGKDKWAMSYQSDTKANAYNLN